MTVILTKGKQVKGRYGISNAVFWEIERRDGQRLRDASSVPYIWSERQALAFKSKAQAEQFIYEKFGMLGAKMSGIKPVRA